MTERAIPVCIVGAGPYGLSVAAHLRNRGIETRVFGEPLGSWRRHMPAQMFLKSVASVTSLSSPTPGSELADYCNETGKSPLSDEDPIPIDLFIRYGLWFQNRLVPDVEQREVRRISISGNTFDVLLDSGEEVRTRAVVMASGHVSFAHVPPALRALAPDGPSPKAPVSHSSQHCSFSSYADRDVAVIGSGQSALETAALLQEAGARAHVLARRPYLMWNAAPADFRRHWSRRIANPGSRLGPGGWSLYAVGRAPTLIARLPDQTRLRLVRTVLGPAGAWWLRDRVEGIVDVRTGWVLREASNAPSRPLLRAHTGSTQLNEIVVDHVIAATGYRVDVDAISFLDPELRRRLKRVDGWPRLSGSSESSVRGLFFTGLSAAATFGPLFRFVAGTEFAARRLVPALAAISE